MGQLKRVLRNGFRTLDIVALVRPTMPLPLFLLAIAIAGLLTACATQPTPSAFEPPGFWFGLLHGFISPFALIGAFFMNVRVYAFPNSGWWYDLGFILGVGAFFGGGASSR